MKSMSKTKYCKGVQCSKILWMDKNMPEVAEDVSSEAIFKTGTEVGDLARKYFSDYVLVEFDKNISKMCSDTQEYIQSGHNIIAEASFMFEKNFCAVDILRITETGVELIEVKSSTSVNDIYYDDMAYQYYVLTNCGVNVTGVYNMHINNEYVRNGDLDLRGLFKLVDCTTTVLDKQSGVKQKLDEIWKCVESADEPVVNLDIYCETPYECAYKKYCHRNIIEPSVFSISGLQKSKKYKIYKDNIVSFEDIILKKPKLSEKQWKQVKTNYNNEPPTVNKEEIKNFLSTLTYPIYFLDFETFQQAIPQFNGVKPYMQIPFQYSLHLQDTKKGSLEHFEFLGKEGTDPRRELALQLCRDIPNDVCVLAYNMTFEKMVIKNLSEEYTDLATHLMCIHNNMLDLMVPFQKQHYYSKELKGSYSIKYVLPTLCSNDDELNYRSLEDIHNGSEAMAAFADLHNKKPEEIAKTRKNLLAYCKLDTLAMVKILEKLYEITIS